MSLASVAFPEFAFDTSYGEEKKVDGNNIAWYLGFDFRIERLNGENDKVETELTLTLAEKSSNTFIAKLKTVSTFHVQRPQSFRLKCRLLRFLFNIACGHLQGGWKAKNTVASIRTQIPQPYNKLEDDFPELEKLVYEKWDF